MQPVQNMLSLSVPSSDTETVAETPETYGDVDFETVFQDVATNGSADQEEGATQNAISLAAKDVSELSAEELAGEIEALDFDGEDSRKVQGNSASVAASQDETSLEPAPKTQSVPGDRTDVSIGPAQPATRSAFETAPTNLPEQAIASAESDETPKEQRSQGRPASAIVQNAGTAQTDPQMPLVSRVPLSNPASAEPFPNAGPGNVALRDTIEADRFGPSDQTDLDAIGRKPHSEGLFVNSGRTTTAEGSGAALKASGTKGGHSENPAEPTLIRPEQTRKAVSDAELQIEAPIPSRHNLATQKDLSEFHAVREVRPVQVGRSPVESSAKVTDPHPVQDEDTKQAALPTQQGEGIAKAAKVSEANAPAKPISVVPIPASDVPAENHPELGLNLAEATKAEPKFSEPAQSQKRSAAPFRNELGQPQPTSKKPAAAEHGQVLRTGVVNVEAAIADLEGQTGRGETAAAATVVVHSSVQSVPTSVAAAPMMERLVKSEVRGKPIEVEVAQDRTDVRVMRSTGIDAMAQAAYQRGGELFFVGQSPVLPGGRIERNIESAPLAVDAMSKEMDLLGSSATRQPVEGARPQTEIRQVQSIAAQLLTSAKPMPEGTVEITMRPEELGRVRMNLTVSDGALQVVLLAERPETSDLMRRHIDILTQDFRALGYSNVSFDFGGQAKQGESSASGNAQFSPSETDDATAAHVAQTPGGSSTGLGANGRVDIRV